MVFAQPARPVWKLSGDPSTDGQARLHLHPMALAVVEAHGLDPPIARKRPGQADRGVLPAGEQHKGAGLLSHRPPMRDQRPWRKTRPSDATTTMTTLSAGKTVQRCHT